MPKATRITQSYAACETLSDRAYPASRRRAREQVTVREAEVAVVDEMLTKPEKWQGARATDIVGEHMRQRAALAESDPKIDP